MAASFVGFFASFSSKPVSACNPNCSETPILFSSIPMSVVNLPSANPSLPQRSQKPVVKKHRALGSFLGAGISLAVICAFPNTSSAAQFPFWDSSILLREPENALSLPTWAIHVSSVVEWIAAMALVWQYGDKCGYESWKGLSWGMVPLLGGALCACTWHFFYNSESLEILVALQAALTVIGNLTMCIAAFRIYKSTREGSESP